MCLFLRRPTLLGSKSVKFLRGAARSATAGSASTSAKAVLLVAPSSLFFFAFFFFSPAGGTTRSLSLDDEGRSLRLACLAWRRTAAWLRPASSSSSARRACCRRRFLRVRRWPWSSTTAAARLPRTETPSFFLAWSWTSLRRRASARPWSAARLSASSFSDSRRRSASLSCDDWNHVRRGRCLISSACVSRFSMRSVCSSARSCSCARRSSVSSSAMRGSAAAIDSRSRRSKPEPTVRDRTAAAEASGSASRSACRARRKSLSTALLPAPTIVTARPDLPARAVRPTRCT
mmetsp:Transcript_12776/g.38527  ORF Transcript_12776/g.38527 Transcript_12776/m.38527 type:complete len:290 (-) Transcript_12776:305-1174(-)